MFVPWNEQEEVSPLQQQQLDVNVEGNVCLAV